MPAFAWAMQKGCGNAVGHALRGKLAVTGGTRGTRRAPGAALAAKCHTTAPAWALSNDNGFRQWFQARFGILFFHHPPSEKSLQLVPHPPLMKKSILVQNYLPNLYYSISLSTENRRGSCAGPPSRLKPLFHHTRYIRCHRTGAHFRLERRCDFSSDALTRTLPWPWRQRGDGNLFLQSLFWIILRERLGCILPV